MGCAPSDSTDAAVGEELLIAKQKATVIHKLLLLGAGNSGKSTFMKQLMSIHGDGTEAERRDKRGRVQDSVVEQMGYVLTAYATSTGDEEYLKLSSEVREAALEINALQPDGSLTRDLARAIKICWAAPELRQMYDERKSLSIVDSCQFFFDDIERLTGETYMPTEEDYLLARIKTTGVNMQEFVIEGNRFQVHDVGGQRSERSKWIHCFDRVDAVLFVAALSCYDQTLHEDEEKNAMIESLELFEECINNYHFKQVGFILFLNKRDLFLEKMTPIEDMDPAEEDKRQLKYWFDDYEGADYDYEAGVKFLTEIYKKQSRLSEKKKPIFAHVTCATDKKTTQQVFDDVQNQVVLRALRRNDLIS
jgi:GTPase SAR1 family protein